MSMAWDRMGRARKEGRTGRQAGRKEEWERGMGLGVHQTTNRIIRRSRSVASTNFGSTLTRGSGAHRTPDDRIVGKSTEHGTAEQLSCSGGVAWGERTSSEQRWSSIAAASSKARRRGGRAAGLGPPG